ncbi:MAG: phage tail tip lysozyme [Eubacteriales bacterium]|nr:phage tail tip lysozyme [Eubacteriales bacterium]
MITVPSNPADNDAHIWSSLLSLTGNPYGAAGLMGNLYAESTLRPNNLQNTYEKSLGMTDEQYTAAVDNGSYTNFIRDSAGYGLAQWAYWSRKEALLNFAHASGKSIGDLDMQLDFLAAEIAGYKAVMEKLKTVSSVREASDAVLTGYERPADQSGAAQERRAGFGQKYYDKYANTPTTPPDEAENGLAVGSIVEFLPTATTYTPGGKTIPAWVKGYFHRVTKDEYRGKERVVNGAVYVCLGEKRAKSMAASQPFEAGINTWVAVSNLRLVAKESDTVDDNEGEGETGADSSNFTLYPVAANDTFWGIAKRFLGSGARYTEIKALNGLTSNIISVGMKIKIPIKG